MSAAALLALIASGELQPMSRREAAVRAAVATVQAIAGLTVLRGPEPAGLAQQGPYCHVEESDPVEAEPPTLGIVRRHFDLRVQCLLFVERQTTAAATRGALDALIVQAAALFEADRTLGGIIDDLIVEPAGQFDDLSPEGANEAASAVLPLTFYYSTGRNPEEAMT